MSLKGLAVQVRRQYEEALSKLQELREEIEPRHRQLKAAQAEVVTAFSAWNKERRRS